MVAYYYQLGTFIDIYGGGNLRHSKMKYFIYLNIEFNNRTRKSENKIVIVHVKTPWWHLKNLTVL